VRSATPPSCTSTSYVFVLELGTHHGHAANPSLHLPPALSDQSSSRREAAAATRPSTCLVREARPRRAALPPHTYLYWNWEQCARGHAANPSLHLPPALSDQSSSRREAAAATRPRNQASVQAPCPTPSNNPMLLCMRMRRPPSGGPPHRPSGRSGCTLLREASAGDRRAPDSFCSPHPTTRAVPSMKINTFGLPASHTISLTRALRVRSKRRILRPASPPGCSWPPGATKIADGHAQRRRADSAGSDKGGQRILRGSGSRSPIRGLEQEIPGFLPAPGRGKVRNFGFRSDRFKTIQNDMVQILKVSTFRTTEKQAIFVTFKHSTLYEK
jgi:hypothetical protein